VNDDEVLIERTLAGDAESFGKLALKYQDRVYNLALPIVGNPEDAMDVTQEAFIQALTHLRGFRRSSRFYTWLYRIAYNCAVGLLRRRKYAVSIDSAIESYGDFFESDVEQPDERARRSDNVRLIRAALAKLPLEYRAPLTLREIEGANYEQIAEILDIPVGTVRSRLHRARAALREELERAGLNV
jgi:RNA polymerase sigma-70 factor (ECF subfamily)